jgi:hypothetical protein
VCIHINLLYTSYCAKMRSMDLLLFQVSRRI